jgi:hypothetical protein
MPTFRGKRLYRKKPAMAKKAKSKKTTASFNRRVLAVVNRGRERKNKVFNLLVDTPLYGSGLTMTGQGHHGQVVDIMGAAAIVQGTTQDSRIGNRIGNVKLNIRGFVRTREFNANTNPYMVPYEVHILVYKNKLDHNGAFTSLKNDINGVSSQVTGDAMNTLRPWNRDMYIIKKHLTLKMNAQPEVATQQHNPAVLINPQSGFNPVMRRFSIDIPVAKNWIYNDLGNIPLNDWCHVAAYVVNGDGVTFANTVSRCVVSMDAYLSFEDA